MGRPPWKGERRKIELARALVKETAQQARGLLGPGGADRDRTDDLRLAKPALSQLSYSPRIVGTIGSTLCTRIPPRPGLVGLGGFEPPTSRLSGERSNQLSYRPAGQSRRLVEPEPKVFERPSQRLRDEHGGLPGLQKLNSVRHTGTDDPKAPRLNESPGEPGIQAFAAPPLTSF